MRANGVEAARAHYREAGTKKDAHNRNCAQMGSVYLGVFLYVMKFKGVIKNEQKICMAVETCTSNNTYSTFCAVSQWYREWNQMCQPLLEYSKEVWVHERRDLRLIVKNFSIVRNYFHYIKLFRLRFTRVLILPQV